MLKKTTITKGALRTPAIEETTAPTKTDLKSKIQFEVQEEVGDHKDMTEDALKIQSLIMSALFMIWDIIPDEQKDNLAPEQKGFINYAREKFRNTTTLADIKFQQNGVEEIDKLLGRQGKIGEIVLAKSST